MKMYNSLPGNFFNNFTNLSKLLLFFKINLSKSFPLWIYKRIEAPQENNIMYKKIDMFVLSCTFSVSSHLFLLFLSRKESSGLVPTYVLPYTNLYQEVNLTTNPCFIGQYMTTNWINIKIRTLIRKQNMSISKSIWPATLQGILKVPNLKQTSK